MERYKCQRREESAVSVYVRERDSYEGHSGYGRQRPFVARQPARREKKRVKTQGEKLLYCVCAHSNTYTHQLCCLFTTSFFSDIRPHGPRRYSTRSARRIIYKQLLRIRAAQRDGHAAPCDFLGGVGQVHFYYALTQTSAALAWVIGR